MGMLLRRHKKKTSEAQVAPKVVLPPVYSKLVGKKVEKKSPPAPKVPDYESMQFFDLKEFAKHQGIDTNVYRKKVDILEQLDKKFK